MRARETDPIAAGRYQAGALNIDLKLLMNSALPELDLQTPAGKLSQELVKATTQEQPAVLAKLRDSKGVVYTEALAGYAIPHLAGGVKGIGPRCAGRTHDQDAESLATCATNSWGEPDPEIRRNAILAAAMSEDKSFVPDILCVFERSFDD